MKLIVQLYLVSKLHSLSSLWIHGAHRDFEWLGHYDVTFICSRTTSYKFAKQNLHYLDIDKSVSFCFPYTAAPLRLWHDRLSQLTPLTVHFTFWLFSKYPKFLPFRQLSNLRYFRDVTPCGLVAAKQCSWMNCCNHPGSKLKWDPSKCFYPPHCTASGLYGKHPVKLKCHSTLLLSE